MEARDKIAGQRMAEKIAMLVLKNALGVDVNGNPIENEADVRAADVQRKEALLRQDETKRKIAEIKNGIDMDLERNNLLE